MASFVLAASLAATCGAAPSRRPVVVVTDCGASVDDEWALAHLAVSPAFDLRGVITTHAPTLPPLSAESSARAARAWLDRFSMAARPRVVAGSSLPLDDRDGRAAGPAPGAAYLIEESRGSTAGR